MNVLQDALVRSRNTGRSVLISCPLHRDQSPSLSVKVVPGKVLFHCFSKNCDYDQLRDLVPSDFNRIQFPTGQTKAPRDNDSAAKLWEGSLPAGEEVRAYLASRGLQLDKIPSSIRFAPHTGYSVDGELYHAPAMLAKVEDSQGNLVTVHRTFFLPDGSRLKRLMPCIRPGATKGAAIRLDVFRGSDILGIAEGIETAIAASLLFKTQVWSCVSASGIRYFVPPHGVRKIVVFADNDASGVGLEAANEFASRARTKEVLIKVPPVVGQDWLDVWNLEGRNAE